MHGPTNRTTMGHYSSAADQPEKRHCASASRPDMAPPRLEASPSRQLQGTPVQAVAADVEIVRRDEQRHPAHPYVVLERHAAQNLYPLSHSPF